MEIKNNAQSLQGNKVKVKDKYKIAAAFFWGASFFAGAAVATIISYRGFHSFESLVIGAFIFLCSGLASHGAVTLMKKM